MATKTNNSTSDPRRQVLQGVVVSAKIPKTIVVEVERYFKHAKYDKYIRRSKRYLAHDEADHQVGDQVSIGVCRPLSKRKHFMVLRDTTKS
ncbi:MAG: 30S ribosomal protein S17 [Patescibacteria group bacterium]|nr:30S ribosomal protein S17 [Patescibacteria group bacterium]